MADSNILFTIKADFKDLKEAEKALQALGKQFESVSKIETPTIDESFSENLAKAVKVLGAVSIAAIAASVKFKDLAKSAQAFASLNPAMKKFIDRGKDIANFAKSEISGVNKAFGQFEKKGFLGFIDTLSSVPTASFAASSALNALGLEFYGLTQATQLASIALATISTIGLTLITDKIGRFISDAGTRLFDWMRELGSKVAKAEAVFAQFSFTISNFINKFGSELIGTESQWTALMQSIVDTSNFSMQSVQKGARLAVAEGAALGLEFNTVSKILERSKDLAASTGKDFEDVVASVLAGISGNSQALFSLGILTNSYTLTNNELAKSLGKTAEQLTDVERKVITLSEFFEQSSVIVGASAAALETVDGKSKKLDTTIESITLQIGQQGVVTKTVIGVFQSFALLISELPASFWSLIGTLTDTVSVMLKVVGTFIQYSVIIATVTAPVKLLGLLLKNTATTGVVVTAVLNKLSSVLGTAGLTKNVTSLNDVFSHLGRILSKSVLISIRAVFVDLVKIAAFMAPLVLKIGAVVAVVGLVVEGFVQLQDETQFVSILFNALRHAIEPVIGYFSDLATDTTSLGDVLKVGLNVALAATTLVLTQMGNAVAGVVFAVTSLASKLPFLSDQMKKSLEEAAGFASEAIDRLQSAAARAAIAILNLGEDTAYADTAIKRHTQSTVAAASGASGLSEELQKLLEKSEETAVAIENVDSSTKEITKTFESVSKEIEMFVDRLQEQVNAIAIQELSNVDQIKVSIALEKERLSSLVRELEASAQISEEQKQQLKYANDLLNTIEQISIARAPIASDDDLRIMQEIARTAQKIEQKNREAGKSQFDIQQIALQAQLDQLDAVRDRLQLELKSTENAERQLAIAKQIDQLAAQEIIIKQQIEQPAEADSAGGFLPAGDALGNMLGEGLMSILGPELGKMFTQFTNILGLILQAPALINAVTSFIDQIAELPIKLLEAVVGFVKSIGTFIPRLIEGLMRAIPEIVMALISLLFEVLPNLTNQAIEMGFKFTEGILKKLPEIITKLIVGFITVVPRVVAGFIRAIIDGIPAIVKGIIQSIPEIVRALVDGIMQAFSSIGDMFSGLLGEAGGGLEDIGSSISEGFESAGESIATSSSELFALLDSNAEARGLGISDRIAKAIDSATNRTAIVWERIMAALRAVWDFIKKYVWEPMMVILEATWMVIKASWDAMMLVLEHAWDAIKIIWDAMMSVLSATWDFVKSTWDIMVGFLKGVWDEMMNLLSGVWDGIKSIWDGMMTILSGLWDGVKLMWDTFIVKPLQAVWDFVVTLFDDPIAAFKGLWEDITDIFDDFINGLTGIWEKLRSGFASITEGLDKIASSLWDFAENIAAKFVEAAGKLWSETQKLFGKFGDIIGGAATQLWNKTKQLFAGLGNEIKGAASYLWNALKEKVSGIGGVVVESINGALRKAGNFLSNVFKFDGGGRGSVENFLGFDFPWFAFAEGGVVPGVPKRQGDNAANDTVPALLSPGEIVIPRSMTSDKAFMAVLDAKFNGREVPQFSLGGAFKAISRGDFKGAKKQIEKTAVGQVIVKTGDAITRNVINPLVNAFSKIGKQAEVVYKFLQNLGASMPPIKDLISNPVKALQNAFQGVAKGFFLPEAKKGIQRNAGILSFAEGGLVPGYARGGTVDTDTIPARLTAGEFVMSRQAVGAIGVGNLQAMNNRAMPAQSSPVINIEMTVNSSEKVDVKKLIAELKSELRRESLRGSFLIAQNGIRG